MKKAIISFTHTNYCIRSAGTEKFVRSISKILQKEGYNHLNLFSFYDDKKTMKTKMIGVNYNDIFQGIYKYSDLQKVVDFYGEKLNLQYTAIHLQHLLHHDLRIISKLIHLTRLPVYVFLHDYHVVCSNLKLIHTDGYFCGISLPDNKKCKECKYMISAEEHKALMKQFFANINPYIEYLITPSDYVSRHMKEIFPEYAMKIITRPHITLSGSKKHFRKHQKIRIAFAGGQYKEKGFFEYKEIVKALAEKEDTYEFYYFGTGKETIDHVKSVYVSNAQQGEDAMVCAIQEHDIDCAILWPSLPETYSYVYYELLMCGVYCLTNKNSGNICDEVIKRNNGKVFDNLEECVCWLKNEEGCRQSIEEFCDQEVIPEFLEDNQELTSIVGSNKLYTSFSSCKILPDILMTFLYKVKYRTLLNSI